MTCAPDGEQHDRLDLLGQPPRANALLPGSVQTGRRAIWQLDQVQVFDGGAGRRRSTAGNGLFATQGVLVP